MLKKLIFIIFLSITTVCNATEIDSLLHLLDQASSSKEKASLNLEIAKKQSKPDSVYKYSMIALSYAKDISDTTSYGAIYKSIGVSYHLSSSYENALSYYDSALIYFSNDTESNAIARIHSNKCGIYIRFGSLDSAIYHNEKCKEYSLQTEDRDLDRIYLKRKANIYSMQGHYEEAITVLRDLQHLPGLSKKSTILNYKDIGINFFDMGVNDSALYYYHLSKKINNNELPYDQISILNNIANVHIFTSEYEEAIKSYLEAMHIADSIQYDYGEALIGSNMANVYFNWNDFEKAISIYKQHLPYLIENSIFRNLVINYLNIGIAYNSIDQQDSSIVYLKKAEKICIETDNKSLLSTTYHNIGRYYYACDEYVMALDYYEMALKANKRENNINTKANVFHDMSLSLSNTEEYSKALLYADSAKSIYKQIDNIKQYIDIDFTISDILASKGDYKEAYKKLNQYRQQNDSVFTKEKHKQISELETQYKTAQKESEIQKQKVQIADNKLIINNEKNKALTYAVLLAGAAILLLLILIFLLRNKQKHMLIKTELENHKMELQARLLRSQMNPHFIFNSLNSIQSYITANDQFNAETYLSKFAKLMRAILENSRHSFISLDQDLSTLKNYIELEHLRFEGEFKYNIEVDKNIDLDNTYIPPMLLQPYIENAIVHGLVGHSNNKGQLSISFHKTNKDQIRCIVEDNGIGREKARELKKRSIKPYKSLGMQVTKERMEVISEINQVHFDEKFIDLKNDNNEAIGTRVELIIPFEKD